jgi:hypothetical protein
MEVVDAQVLCHCQGQQQVDRLRACHQCKDFIEVALLVLDNGAALVQLDLVDPFVSNWLASFWRINQLPSMVLLNCLRLLQHRSSPISVMLSLR